MVPRPSAACRGREEERGGKGGGKRFFNGHASFARRARAPRPLRPHTLPSSFSQGDPLAGLKAALPQKSAFLNISTWGNQTVGGTWGTSVDGGGSAGFSKNVALTFKPLPEKSLFNKSVLPAVAESGVALHIDGGGGGGAGVVVTKGVAKGGNPYVPIASGSGAAPNVTTTFPF